MALCTAGPQILAWARDLCLVGRCLSIPDVELSVPDGIIGSFADLLWHLCTTTVGHVQDMAAGAVDDGGSVSDLCLQLEMMHGKMRKRCDSIEIVYLLWIPLPLPAFTLQLAIDV